MAEYFDRLLNDILRSADGLEMNGRIDALRRQRQKHERKCFAQGQHMQRLIDNGTKGRHEYVAITALRMEQREFIGRYHKFLAELAFATRSAVMQSVLEDSAMELDGLLLERRIHRLESRTFDGLKDTEAALFRKHKFMSYLIRENGGDRMNDTSSMRRAMGDILDLQHHKETYDFQIGRFLEEARARRLRLEIYAHVRVYSVDIEDEVHRLEEKDVPQYHEIQRVVSRLEDLLRTAKDDEKALFEIKELNWELEGARFQRGDIEDVLKNILRDQRYAGFLFRSSVEPGEESGDNADSAADEEDGAGYDVDQDVSVPEGIEMLISGISRFHIELDPTEGPVSAGSTPQQSSSQPLLDSNGDATAGLPSEQVEKADASTNAGMPSSSPIQDPKSRSEEEGEG